MSVQPPPPFATTLADLLEALGDIDPRRVRASPPPGTASEADLLALLDRGGPLYELVDGALVEKGMGFLESTLACDLIRLLGNFLEQNPLGILAGESGPVRLMAGLVRIPDVSFFSWSQFAAREWPREPIAPTAPDLAVEILSAGNTKKEMARKIREYFLHGVRVAWFVDLNRRTVTVYTAPDQYRVLKAGQTLDGGTVLPGLALPLRQLFAGIPATPGPRGKPSRPRNPAENQGKRLKRK